MRSIDKWAYIFMFFILMGLGTWLETDPVPSIIFLSTMFIMDEL